MTGGVARNPLAELAAAPGMNLKLAETVHGGDHYRVLFVIGVVLFLITCTINVISDLVIKGVKQQAKS